MSRDQVVSAIYEAVLRPELYENVMEAWEGHLDSLLDDPEIVNRLDQRDAQGGLEIDPELQAHFERAHQILEQLGRKDPSVEMQHRISDAAGFVLLVASDERVRAAGAAARTSLGEGFGLDALKEHLTPQGTQLLGELILAARKGELESPPLILATDFRPRYLIARLADTPGAECQVVIEGLDFQWTQGAERMLVASFGLSPAEVDIVRNLLNGSTLREIAASSGRSEHTVRNQAKSVLAKTGAPSQVDLIRLVAFLIDKGTREKTARTGAVALRNNVLNMKTGLKMQLFQCGDPEGRPVLYLHGMLDGMAPLYFLQDRFTAAGLRVFAPARPGYALSDPASDPAAALDAITAHADELIQTYDLNSTLILGQMAGGVVGHIVCARLGNRIAGMVAVSSGGPVIRHRQIAKMAPRQRAMAYTARYAPSLLPFFVRAGVALVDNGEAGHLMDSLYRTGSHERLVVERLDLSELMYAGYRFAVQSGTEGFTSDGQTMVRNWEPLIKQATQPVIHLHGAHDPVIPAEETREFANRHSLIDFRLRPDAGQFLLYEEPETVLSAIKQLQGL